jgi:cell division protein FtsX
MSRLARAPIHVREGLRIVLRRPVAALVASLTLGLGLFVAALSAWSAAQLDEAQVVLERDLRLFAALDPALDEGQTRAALEIIATDPAVRTVRWVGPLEQRERLGAVVGEALLEGLDREVFPIGGLAEIEIARPVIQDEAALGAFRARLESIDQVHGIEGFPFDSRHIRLLLDAAAVSRVLGLTVGLVGLLAALLAVFLLIQSERRRYRATLQIYRDFGATAAFIRARFFVAAAVLALAGATGAVFLAALASAPLGELVSIVPGLESASIIGPALYAWALVGALVIGIGGCALALRGEGRVHGAVTAEGA